MKRHHRIGAHTSAAGGVDRAAAEAAALGCNTVQVFTRSPRRWRGSAPSPASVTRLVALRQEHDLHPLAVHGSYLTNLAAANPEVQRRSRTAFRQEIENARAIGADYLVIHPGSAKGQSRQCAIEVFATALAAAQSGFDWGALRLLLENTAGGGDTLGRSFEELRDLGQAVAARCDAPLGFCVDTAHSLASGYEISTAQGLDDTVQSMQACLGVDQVHLVHANDSRAEFGSRCDRHESIGDGHIGAEAFARILKHPQLQAKAFILETPLIDGSHRENIRRLWELAGEPLTD